MKEFDLRYRKYLSEFETYTAQYLQGMHTKPVVLGASMQYSLLNGGKRIRPVLLLACADLLGVPSDEALPFALALEMIHTYSLIHDDLPAMDNDDFRRGKPSCHKAFGEANAILAGDGLLNEAYAICLNESLKGERFALAGKFLNDCAGIYGMIAGQAEDLRLSGSEQEISEDDLLYIHEQKTGKLLLAPISISAILSGNKCYMELERFGILLGKLFQMTDDILDVTGDFEQLGKTTGKDEKENKLTYVRVFGLEGAKMRAEECAKDCFAVLEGIEGDVSFLHGLTEYVLTRKK